MPHDTLLCDIKGFLAQLPVYSLPRGVVDQTVSLSSYPGRLFTYRGEPRNIGTDPLVQSSSFLAQVPGDVLGVSLVLWLPSRAH